MPGNRQKLFLYQGFLGLSFFITIVLLKKIIFTISIIVTVIIPLPCNKPVGKTPQGRSVISHCLITHLLRLILVRKIFQQLWIRAHCFTTYFLCFITVGDILQLPWASLDRFNTHLLCFEVIRDCYYPAWNIFIRHIYLCLWTQARVKFYGQNADQPLN